MTRRRAPNGTSLCLTALAMCYLLAGSNIVFVLAEAEPLPPAMIYGDNLSEDTESLMLVNRLKQLAERKQDVVEQERELTEEQIAIQALLEAKSSEDQPLPYPAKVAFQGAMSGPPASRARPVSFLYSQQPKRRAHPNNMSLCYFKICNMGRKRQM